MPVSIVTGPRRSVLRHRRREMYHIVKHNIDRKWFVSMMNNPMRGNNYAVVTGKGKLMGFAVMGRNSPREGGAAYIYLIGTKSGRGYGTQLMNRIISNARGRGLRYVLLEPITERVRAFYRKFGFVDMTPELMVLDLSTRRSPSRPSPTPRASSAGSSVRQSVSRQTPRR